MSLLQCSMVLLRPDRSDRRLRTVIATSYARVLRRPIELAQYVSIKYTERLAEAGIEPSVGSVGDSYDNALAETVNGLYKAEVIHRRGPWRSFQAVELVTLEWVDWFNNRRLLEPIGNIPPSEAEERRTLRHARAVRHGGVTQMQNRLRQTRRGSILPRQLVVWLRSYGVHAKSDLTMRAAPTNVAPDCPSSE